MKVLFVDDEKIIREGMREIIDWKGIGCCQLTMADNATKALELLEQEEFDLVITDIYMKRMTGIELARQIKASRPHIKVIILSAYEDFSYAREAIEAGVFKYLLKPIVPEELEQTVLEAMEKVDSDRKLQNMVSVYRPQLAKDFWKALLRREISGRADLERRMQLAGIVLKSEKLCCMAVLFEEEGGKHALLCDEKMRIVEKAVELLSSGIDCIRRGPGELTVILSDEPSGNEILDFKQYIGKEAGLKLRTACGKCVENPLELYRSVEAAGIMLAAGEESAQDGGLLVAGSLRLIEQRINEEEFGVNDIYEALHVSAGYFSRIFKKQMGMTCIEYITRKRIEKAKELLEHTDMKHEYIAGAVGYSNVYYFSMQFKKHTGETPGQYRKRMGRSDV